MLKLHDKMRQMASTVPSTISDFLMMVATKRFWIVVPLPIKEFQEKV